MGTNDAREQLEVAKAEVVRLEQERARDIEIWAETDAGHIEARKQLESELATIRRLHEVATERTVQLATVIEKAKATQIRRAGQLDQPSPYPILDAADTSSALAEIRAKAWDEGARAKDIEWAETWDIVTPDEDRFQAVNPYREGA